MKEHLAIFHPGDGGPIYTETNFANFIVEPFNTVSAILFVLMAAYWYWRMKGRYGKHLFLTISTTLLAIGGIGGTLYHGLRNSAFFMYMDWLPILIICLMASIYFMVKVSSHWWTALLVFALVVGLHIATITWVAPRHQTSVGYVISGAFVLIPTFLAMLRTRFYKWWYVAYSLFAFSLALVFRIADRFTSLEIGTHFLWHLFGCLSGFYMFKYVFEINRFEDKLFKKGIHIFKPDWHKILAYKEGSLLKTSVANRQVSRNNRLDSVSN